MCDLRGLSKYEVNQHYFEFVRNATKEGRHYYCVYKCKQCGELNYFRKDIFKSHLQICKNKCNGLGYGRGTIVYDYNDLATINPELAKEWNYERNNILPKQVATGSNQKVWWKCQCGHEWNASIVRRANGADCPYCAKRRVLERKIFIGYNDLATTHPELVKYFVNPEDAKKYTHGSNQKVQLKCPECGKEKWMKLDNLSKQGFSCDRCSDGISYPEKFVSNLFNQLNIKYQKQFKFEGFNYMYDFYLPQYNVIIEVHGSQHYQDSGWTTYKEQHENDLCKYDLAVLNGYEYNKNFFIINARKTSVQYLQDSIKQSKLFTQFDLTNIDWKQIDMKSQKSLKIDVCKYWNEHKNENLTTTNLEKVFGINRATIVNYLNWGNESGLCVYDGKGEQRKRHKRQSIFVFLIKENGEKWFDEPLSLHELSRKTGITRITLKRLLYNKKLLTYGNGAKYDPKYIGSMVVFAEETE